MIENDVKRIKEVLFPEIKNLKEFHSIYPVSSDFKPEVGQKINEMDENFDFENTWHYDQELECLLAFGNGCEYTMPFQPFIFGGFMFDILKPLKKPRLDLDRIIKRDERHLKFCNWFSAVRSGVITEIRVKKLQTWIDRAEKVTYGAFYFLRNRRDSDFKHAGDPRVIRDLNDFEIEGFINFYNTYKK